MATKDTKLEKSSVFDELMKKTQVPLRMLRLFDVSQKVRNCRDHRLVALMMHEIKPEIDEAIKHDATKLEALYRAQVMQIHLDGLIIDALKTFYVSSLKALRSDVDEKVLEINALVSGARPIPEAIGNEACGQETKKQPKETN